MSNNGPLQFLRDEQRQWFHAARKSGGLCAGCGRALVAGDTVWYETFATGGRRPAVSWAAVGRECVSPELLSQTEGQEPERRVGCGRGVHYPSGNTMPGNPRTQAVCSRRCRVLARRARVSASSEED